MNTDAMNINATIVAQIINFVLLYIAIRFLLAKPAARLLLQEEVAQRERMNLLGTQQQALDAYREQRKQLADAYHIFSQKHIPAITCFAESTMPLAIKPLEPVSIDKHQIELIIQDTASAVVRAMRTRL